MIEKLKHNEPIIGDNYPYYSMVYDTVPDGYRIGDLVFRPEWTYLNQLKDRLVNSANEYYRNYEIVGKTVNDFFRGLQNALDINADTFEKMYAVYDDDIAKPTQSRTIKHIYDMHNENTNNDNTTTGGTNSGTVTSKDYELPADNQQQYETSRNVTDNSGESSGTSNTERTGSSAQTGSVTEEWSDVGVAPNYVLLNGFIDNNRTADTVFINFFKDCFTLCEGLY